MRPHPAARTALKESVRRVEQISTGGRDVPSWSLRLLKPVELPAAIDAARAAFAADPCYNWVCAGSGEAAHTVAVRLTLPPFRFGFTYGAFHNGGLLGFVGAMPPPATPSRWFASRFATACDGYLQRVELHFRGKFLDWETSRHLRAVDISAVPEVAQTRYAALSAQQESLAEPLLQAAPAWQLSMVCVPPENAGHGLGHLMVMALCLAADRTGHECHTETASPRAMSLYSRLGFAEAAGAAAGGDDAGWAAKGGPARVAVLRRPPTEPPPPGPPEKRVSTTLAGDGGQEGFGGVRVGDSAPR